MTTNGVLELNSGMDRINLVTFGNVGVEVNHLPFGLALKPTSYDLNTGLSPLIYFTRGHCINVSENERKRWWKGRLVAYVCRFVILSF